MPVGELTTRLPPSPPMSTMATGHAGRRWRGGVCSGRLGVLGLGLLAGFDGLAFHPPLEHQVIVQGDAFALHQRERGCRRTASIPDARSARSSGWRQRGRATSPLSICSCRVVAVFLAAKRLEIPGQVFQPGRNVPLRLELHHGRHLRPVGPRNLEKPHQDDSSRQSQANPVGLQGVLRDQGRSGLLRRCFALLPRWPPDRAASCTRPWRRLPRRPPSASSSTPI